MKCKTKLRRGRTLILLPYRLPLRWIFLTYNAVDVGLVLSNFAEVCQNWWIINLLSSAETSDNIRVDHIFLKSIISFMFELTFTLSLIQQPSQKLFKLIWKIMKHFFGIPYFTYGSQYQSNSEPRRNQFWTIFELSKPFMLSLMGLIPAASLCW